MNLDSLSFLFFLILPLFLIHWNFLFFLAFNKFELCFATLLFVCPDIQSHHHARPIPWNKVIVNLKKIISWSFNPKLRALIKGFGFMPEINCQISIDISMMIQVKSKLKLWLAACFLLRLTVIFSCKFWNYLTKYMSLFFCLKQEIYDWDRHIQIQILHSNICFSSSSSSVLPKWQSHIMEHYYLIYCPVLNHHWNLLIRSNGLHYILWIHESIYNLNPCVWCFFPLYIFVLSKMEGVTSGTHMSLVNLSSSISGTRMSFK